MAAKIVQIDWLKGLDHYQKMYKIKGAFDPNRDYTGPEGNWKAKFVPQTIWGIDIGVCSYIHDYEYAIGTTSTDRWNADATYHTNMKIQIDLMGKNGIHRFLAGRRAWKYFWAVRKFGKEPFEKAFSGGFS